MGTDLYKVSPEKPANGADSDASPAFFRQNPRKISGFFHATTTPEHSRNMTPMPTPLQVYVPEMGRIWALPP
jgi:hypothetical protein